MGKSDMVGPGGVPIDVMDPNYALTDAVQLWVGRPKIGKTSTAAALLTVARKRGWEEINPFFLLCEAGSSGVPVQGTSRKCPECKGTGKQGKGKCPECLGSGVVRLILSTEKEVNEWAEWAAKSPFNPIVIDTGDALYQTISDSVCAELQIASPHDAEYGAAWDRIAYRMRDTLGTLTCAKKGVIILMHVQFMERRMKGGGIMSTATFNIPGKARKALQSMANQILYFDVQPNPKGEGERHVLIAEAQVGIEAGDQWGIFPPELELGTSPEEAAEAILKVFGYEGGKR